ncbi:MAG: hypothetical protein EPN82_06270 [Bacteroidetes bacterium]|nr:MAG: hypothetical protein EPN82_06270 [Bacteroidota bacterium]
MEYDNSSPERRNFLIRAGTLIGLGIAAATIPGLITSCQQNDNPISTNVKKEIDVTQYSELQNDFGAVKIKFDNMNGNMPVIVIRKSAGNYLALTSRCSHQGCEVGIPNSATHTITCPCHGSVYSEVNGSVISGPASQSLKQFPTSFDSATNILTITI